MIDFDYRCTECNKEQPRDTLTVKKVVFTEMGMNPKAIKTRTESWLCPACLLADKAYQIPKGQAPGRVNFNKAS